MAINWSGDYLDSWQYGTTLPVPPWPICVWRAGWDYPHHQHRAKHKVIVCNLVVSLVAHCRWVQASHANSPPWRIFQNPIIGRIPYWAWRTRTFKSRRRHYWLFLKHRRACLPGYGWGNWYVLKSLYLIQLWTSYRLVFWVHHKHYIAIPPVFWFIPIS